jgi:predicted nucleic acid-binding Zn ribbon protein
MTPSTSACVICGTETPDPPALCSTACAARAEREIAENVLRYRQRGAERAAPEPLWARNGQLTSAMLLWRG